MYFNGFVKVLYKINRYILLYHLIIRLFKFYNNTDFCGKKEKVKKGYLITEFPKSTLKGKNFLIFILFYLFKFCKFKKIWNNISWELSIVLYHNFFFWILCTTTIKTDAYILINIISYFGTIWCIHHSVQNIFMHDSIVNNGNFNSKKYWPYINKHFYLVSIEDCESVRCELNLIGTSFGDNFLNLFQHTRHESRGIHA